MQGGRREFGGGRLVVGGQVREDEAVEVVNLVSGSWDAGKGTRIAVVGIRSGRRALARATTTHGMPR